MRDLRGPAKEWPVGNFVQSEVPGSIYCKCQRDLLNLHSLEEVRGRLSHVTVGLSKSFWHLLSFNEQVHLHKVIRRADGDLSSGTDSSDGSVLEATSVSLNCNLEKTNYHQHGEKFPCSDRGMLQSVESMHINSINSNKQDQRSSWQTQSDQEYIAKLKNGSTHAPDQPHQKTPVQVLQIHWIVTSFLAIAKQQQLQGRWRKIDKTSNALGEFPTSVYHVVG